MKQIETLASRYSSALTELGSQLAELQEELELVKKPFLKQIKRTIARVDKGRTALIEAVEASPELFVKPRTHVLHGIKCGFTKTADGVDIPDAERTITLIRRHLSEQESMLIKSVESVVLASAKQLTDAELKKIGAARTVGQDKVVVKPQDGEPEKLRKALIGE